MKKTIIQKSIIAAIVWLPFSSTLRAEETAGTGQPVLISSASPLSVAVSVPVLSAYVWRGIVVSDGPVAQPNATISKNGFSFNTWVNYNFTDAYSEETKEQISEVDLTASYSKAVGPVTLGAAYAEYLYPNQTIGGSAAPGTREVQASVALTSLPLTPTLTLVRDIDLIDGFYASLAFSKNFTLSDKIGLALGFSSGAGDKDYNKGYFGVEKAKLNDGNVSASLPIAITSSVTLTPLIQYTWLWDSEIRDQAATLYKDSSSVWGGVTLAFAL
jgi:hypothetical protein